MNRFGKIKRSVRRTALAVSMKHGFESLLVSKGTSHREKVQKVLAAQKLMAAKSFIETGTYIGEMIQSVRKHFIAIHSIELSRGLADEASSYFKDDPSVHIHNGDSGIVLESILSEIEPGPAVFWLDAHYSSGITAKSDRFGNTPILKELRIILSHWRDNNVVLIDDARLFVGIDGYPTFQELSGLCERAGRGLNVFIDSDIIHII